MDEAIAVELARSRWNYAKQQLNDLNEMILRFQDRRPYEVVRDFDPERREHSWQFRVREQLPADFGFRIGDVTHNLRSTLDNLIWGLSKAQGANSKALDDCSYPISTTRDDYWRRDKAGQLARNAGAQRVSALPEAHRLVIESTQPFQTEDPERHPLRFLQLLSNRDKHRRVTVAAAASLGSEVRVVTSDAGPVPFTRRDAQGIAHSPVDLHRGPLVDGTVFARLVMPDVDFEVPMDVHFTFIHVFADEGLLQGRPIFVNLVVILAFIDEHVLSHFET